VDESLLNNDVIAWMTRKTSGLYKSASPIIQVQVDGEVKGVEPPVLQLINPLLM